MREIKIQNEQTPDITGLTRDLSNYFTSIAEEIFDPIIIKMQLESPAVDKYDLYVRRPLLVEIFAQNARLYFSYTLNQVLSSLVAIDEIVDFDKISSNHEIAKSNIVNIIESDISIYLQPFTDISFYNTCRGLASTKERAILFAYNTVAAIQNSLVYNDLLKIDPLEMNDKFSSLIFIFTTLLDTIDYKANEYAYAIGNLAKELDESSIMICAPHIIDFTKPLYTKDNLETIRKYPTVMYSYIEEK